jgi:drug/metabolite transporter (DMT)-like permease
MVDPKTARRRGAETVALLLLVIFLKPFSNLFLAWGMKQMPEALSLNPILYLRAMIEPLVAAGIAMQILWLLLRMKLLGLADLSFVLPVTAVGYVLTTVLGHVFLHEQVSPERWFAVLLIFLGTALVSSTRRPESEQ